MTHLGKITSQNGNTNIMIQRQRSAPHSQFFSYALHAHLLQTFYVTVDISSASTGRLNTNSYQNPRSSSPNPDASANIDPDLDSHDTPSPPQDPNDNVSTQFPEVPTEIPQRFPNRIQILDLHAKNPIISYGNQLYSCNWTTTIGTDIILDPSSSNAPSSPSNPILATTHHKLSARPARLVPRQDFRPSDVTLTVAQPHDAIDLPPSHGNKGAPIPLESHASLARQRQATFLDRLSAIKVAKGEKDQVTVYARKRNTGSGWRSQRKAEFEAAVDDDREGRDDDGVMAEGTSGEDDGDVEAAQGQPTPSDPGRRTPLPRQRGQVRARKYKGALFGDRTPQAGLSRPNGSENESVPTPSQWAELDELTTRSEDNVADENISARDTISFDRGDQATARGPVAESLDSHVRGSPEPEGQDKQSHEARVHAEGSGSNLGVEETVPAEDGQVMEIDADDVVMKDA